MVGGYFASRTVRISVARVCDSMSIPASKVNSADRMTQSFLRLKMLSRYRKSHSAFRSTDVVKPSVKNTRSSALMDGIASKRRHFRKLRRLESRECPSLTFHPLQARFDALIDYSLQRGARVDTNAHAFHVHLSAAIAKNNAARNRSRKRSSSFPPRSRRGEYRSVRTTPRARMNDCSSSVSQIIAAGPPIPKRVNWKAGMPEERRTPGTCCNRSIAPRAVDMPFQNIESGSLVPGSRREGVEAPAWSIVGGRKTARALVALLERTFLFLPQVPAQKNFSSSFSKYCHASDLSLEDEHPTKLKVFAQGGVKWRNATGCRPRKAFEQRKSQPRQNTLP